MGKFEKSIAPVALILIPSFSGSEGAVFILENGASISNVIIGVKQLEGVHCKGSCTLTNVWFRDVCEGK